MQSWYDEERCCLVMRPSSVCVCGVCLCPYITITTVTQSQGESQVKQSTIGMNVDVASIYRIHQLAFLYDFT